MSAVRVAFVAGLATGGTARHIATLAVGCRDAGLDVIILAPAATLEALRADASLAGAGPAAGSGGGMEGDRAGSGDRSRPAGAGSAAGSGGGMEGDRAGSGDRSRPAGAGSAAGSAGGMEGSRAGSGDRSRLAAAGGLSGIEFVTVEIGDRPRPGRDAAAVGRLRAEFAARQPDIVHAHGARAGAFAALAIGSLALRGIVARWPGSRSPAHRAPAGPAGPAAPWRRRPALIVTVHNAPPDGRAARLTYAVLERICARRADLVLGASADLVTRMRGLGAEAEQFEVPAAELSPPPPAAVGAARADIGANGRPVVLAVGRLAAQKGFDVLVAAAAQWGGRNPRPRTVIAGDGPLGAQLRTQARQSGADVVLLGARDDVAALLAVADVVVVPSRWEARALILQEAMRAGCPVVASRVGGTPELTGEDGALLVPPAEPAELAAAVARVLDDPQLAARLSAAARRRSAAFPAVEAAVAATLSIYRRILPDHS